MAGFQESLKDVTVPTASRITGGGGQVAAPSTAQTVAQVGSALFDLGTKGLQLFEDLEKKEVVESYNKKLLNLIEAKNQGTINSGEFNTKINAAYVEAGKSSPENLQLISGVTKDTLGFVPFASEAKAQQSVEDSWRQFGSAILPNGTDKEQEEAGREMYVAQQRAATSKARMDAAAASSKANEKAILSTSADFMNEILSIASLEPLITSSRILASEASTLSDKERANSSLQQVQSLLTVARGEYVKGLSTIKDADTYNKALDRWDSWEKRQLDLFDPQKGPLDLQKYTQFAQAMKNNNQMSTMETTQFLTSLKDVLGSEALGTIMSQVIINNPETEQALAGMIESEVNNLVRGGGLTDQQGLRISTVLEAMKSPEQAEILAAQGSVRTDKLTQNIGIFNKAMNQSDLNDDTVQGTWANSSLTYAQMGIAHLNKPENVHAVTKGFDNMGHTRNLAKLENLNPQLAQEVGQRVQTVAVKDLTGLMRSQESQYVRYDPGQRKFIPLTPQEIQSASDGQLRGGAITGISAKASAFAKKMNISLNVAAAHSKYDPASSKVSGPDIRNYFVFQAQAASGTDYMKGEKLPAIDLKDTPASVSEVAKFFKPTAQVFGAEASRIESVARERRTALLKGEGNKVRRISFQGK